MTDVQPATPDETADAETALATTDPLLDLVEHSLRTGDRPEIIEQELTPEEQQLKIVERVLRSQSADEVLGSFDTQSLDSALDRPFDLFAIRFEKSEYEQGEPFYVMLDVTFVDTGEATQLTTGATNIVAQCVKLKRLGQFPQRIVARKSAKPTARGFYPKHLQRAV